MRQFHVRRLGVRSWVVEPDAQPAATGFSTRRAAEAAAVGLARERGGEVVVHAADGRIVSTSVQPAGYGSLRGKFFVRKGVDITKPIAEQVNRLRRSGE